MGEKGDFGRDREFGPAQLFIGMQLVNSQGHDGLVYNGRKGLGTIKSGGTRQA